MISTITLRTPVLMPAWKLVDHAFGCTEGNVLRTPIDLGRHGKVHRSTLQRWVANLRKPSWEIGMNELRAHSPDFWPVLTLDGRTIDRMVVPFLERIGVAGVSCQHRRCE